MENEENERQSSKRKTKKEKQITNREVVFDLNEKDDDGDNEIWRMMFDEWRWCDEVICVVIIRLIKNDWNGWIDELCEMALSNILTKWFETISSCHLKNKILCFCV